MLCVKIMLLEICNCEKVEDTFSALKALLRYLDNLNEVSIYTDCEVKNALRYITPFIHLKIVQCIVAIKTEVTSEKKMLELKKAYAIFCHVILLIL